MDFFERQELARRKTGRLIVYFVIAVVMIVCAVNAAGYGILRAAGEYQRSRRDAAPVFRGDRTYPGRFSGEIRLHERYEAYVAITLVTLGIILCGSAYKTIMLAAGGGTKVAELMGGRPIAPHADAPEEKALQNVVEEMSIASGVPVPQIFVMDEEEGINAFAAGFTPSDAVIAVTRGCLTKLTRDELQGVIAHEFSHILNGDMRLNLRLIGILNGILVMALIGFTLLRSIRYVGVGRSRRDDKGGAGQAIIVIMLAGAAMVVIGYVGVFFGRLIQAAVSRQREYLADASAVQFTRNPLGLAGALKKIGRYSAGSSIHNAHALEMAHLFFASGMRIGLTNLLATHPPLEERIKALDPTFTGQFEFGAGTTRVLDEQTTTARGDALANMLAGAAAHPVDSDERRRVDASQITAAAGTLRHHHVVAAQQTLANIPPILGHAAREPFGARAVALTLLLSDDSSVRSTQVQSLQSVLDVATVDETLKLAPIVLPLDRAARVALMDLIQPAIKQLSPPQLKAFAAAAKALIESDGRITLFEYAMFRQLRRQLAAALPDQRPRTTDYYSLRPLLGDVSTILSALAYSGNGASRGADAFRAGFSRLETGEPVLPVNDYSLRAVDASLTRLAHASPGVTRRVIDAAAHTVAADGIVQPEEAELLRAICAALDVPVPILT